jgi:DNA-directed RNA polymerase specialized sigma24 family protein
MEASVAAMTLRPEEWVRETQEEITLRAKHERLSMELRAELKQVFAETIGRTTLRRLRVIYLHYHVKMTYGEVAKEMGISAARARQLCVDGLRELGQMTVKGG